MDEKCSGLEVPARLIPTPTTVSPEAQAFLSRGLGVMPPEIPHTDKEAYRRYIAMVDQAMTPIAEARAKPFPAAIAEHRLTHCTLYEVTPESMQPANAEKAILHIHGGAFIVGGGRTAAYTAQTIAGRAGLKSYSVDYRMPPDFPFPHGLDDCVEAYRWLLERYAPENIALEGSSAGANLVAATILKARDQGLPLPAACSLHTAGVDMTHVGDTFATNEVIDVVLRKAGPETMALYMDGNDPRDPYLSPVFADLTKGFPPTILVSGTRDLLLSPTVMMHRALRRAGIEADLHVFEAMPHGGLSGSSPEDAELQEEIAGFLRRKLGAV
jgi:epsilon-lactone hydrolase